MHSTQAIIEDIRQGKMVILMDDEDRENEGDIIVAADCITEAHINFMATHARGLICMPMSKEKCEALELPLMTAGKNGSKFGTNFTVSIEAATGVTTGISVPDRTRTIQVAAQKNAKACDITQPGHIFPIMAQPGGVLTRSGHTEASCDLAELAGFSPQAVICEILNADGTMARKPDLEIFAKEHDLKIGTIADLIHYRFEREQTVANRVKSQLPTRWGTFDVQLFECEVDGSSHLAITYGQPQAEASPVRIQNFDPIYDLPGVQCQHMNQPGRWPLDKAMETIVAHGHGAIIMLNYTQQNANRWSKARMIEEIGLLDKRTDLELGSDETISDWAVIGIGSQILSNLGFSKLSLLGDKKRFHGLSGFGLEVVEYCPYQLSI